SSRRAAIWVYGGVLNNNIRKSCFLGQIFPGIRSKLLRRRTRAVVSREAYGVRGACSRFRTVPHIRQREQAPRTPYASRHLVPPCRLCRPGQRALRPVVTVFH